MTKREAERTAERLNLALNDQPGISADASVWLSDEGDGYEVIANIVAGRRTAVKTYTTPIGETGLADSIALSKRLLARSQGKEPPRRPPVSTQVADGTPLPSDWIDVASRRVMGLSVPYSLASATMKFLRMLEINGIDPPIVFSANSQVFMLFRRPGKTISVRVNGENIKIYVTEAGEVTPWADDIHQIPKGRAIPSLRVWLRWMFPDKAIS